MRRGSDERRADVAHAGAIAPIQVEGPVQIEGSVEVEGFDRFELIGSGGYSRVYRARQAGFDRLVAVKVLNVDVASDDRRRAFERECRALGTLSEHPNIVTVLSAATAGSKPCIVMELYSGGTLSDRVRADGALDVEQLLHHGVLICGALQTAHDRGVVHRDIKPQNLFVSDYGRPALGDFGISSFDGDLTVTGAGGGLTVHYAPPEVLEGQSAGALSDLYSLAATLYFLAAGERPFPPVGEQTMADVACRILVEAPPRLAEQWPASLSELLRRGMAKHPAQRPRSAEELGRSLQDIQRELGLAVTELPLVRRDVGSSSAPGSPGSAVSASFDPGNLAGVGRWRSPSRAARSWLLAGGVAAAVAATLAMAVVFGDDPSERSRPVVGPSTTDGFFSVPATPAGVAVERSGATVTVRWDPTANAGSYQVERMDAAAAGTVLEATEPEVVLPVEDGQRPCVTVVAVGADGRLSRPSAVVCAEE